MTESESVALPLGDAALTNRIITYPFSVCQSANQTKFIFIAIFGGKEMLLMQEPHETYEFYSQESIQKDTTAIKPKNTKMLGTIVVIALICSILGSLVGAGCMYLSVKNLKTEASTHPIEHIVNPFSHIVSLAQANSKPPTG